MGVGGAASRTHLRAGPPQLAARRQRSLTLAGPRRMPCSPRTPEDDTLSRSARRGAQLPLLQHPGSPALSCPHRQACPSCSLPWMPGRMGLGLAQGGRCLMHKCTLSVRPPTCPGSETLWPSLESSWVTHPKARRRSRACPWHSAEQWPLAASSASPDASVILSAPLGTLAVGSDIIFPSWKPIIAPGNLQPPGTRQIEDTCTVQSSTYPGASLVLGNFSKSVSFLIKVKILLSVLKNGLGNEWGKGTEISGVTGDSEQQ